MNQLTPLRCKTPCEIQDGELSTTLINYTRCVYGARKGLEGEYVSFRTYDSAKDTCDISIAKAAVAILAARGLFAEVPLLAANGSKILCLDKGHPLGLIDPTKLVLDEVAEVFPGEEIHTIISIGSGHVAIQDIPDLLRLAYPSPFFRIPWPFQQYHVPKDETARVNEGLKEPQVRTLFTYININ